MLRLEEVQFVNWGPLRPDTVPFMTHAINLITGTNGSAKTCFVNGIKVLLGVSLPKGSEAREWIFNPLALDDLGDSIGQADQAVLRGTFCNPIARAGHRFFSWEGSDFELEEHATVVCVVRRDLLRYRILPGRIQWEQPISKSVPEFMDENPIGGQKWKGPRLYDQSLSRMGVSQAMRGVLALPQGETGEILNETPTGLLKKILQLNGKQEIIDAYAEQRKKFEQAQTKYRDTAKSLELEKATLERRSRDAEKYEEWSEHRQEHDRLRDVLIPAAKYRDLVKERDQRSSELVGLERSINAKSEELRLKEKEIPARREELVAAARQLDAIRTRRDSAGRRLRRLEGVLARLETAAASAKVHHQRGVELVAGRNAAELEAMRAGTGTQWKAGLRALQALDEEVEILTREAEALRAGQAAAPEQVRQFRDALTADGITTMLVADVLEPVSFPVRQVEAALGDAVWALVVPDADFERAVIAARDADYGYPIARAGFGHPAAVLAGTRGPSELSSLLADLDTPSTAEVGTNGNADHGVGADGFFHLPSMAHLRAPASPRIGRGARTGRLAVIERRLPVAEEERARRAPHVQAAAQLVREIEEAIALWPQLEELWRRAERLADRARVAGSARAEALSIQSQRSHDADELGPSVGELRDQIKRLQQEIDERRPDLASLRNQLSGYQSALQAADTALGSVTLSESQRDAYEIGDLGSSDDLQRQCARVESLVNNEERYPLEIRTDQVLAQRDEQRDVVQRAEDALHGVEKDMEDHQKEVDRAREAYDANVNATVRLLDARFREVCKSAGVLGELHRVAGEARGEYGLDVRAAHKQGERPISYQRKNFHSGGQTVKIAILLLLAAMSMGDEGSAEMLIMDEPIAHMSVENADQIAEVIVSLKDKAQFILAMPTNAETLRVDWAEWQISLFGREPGQPRSPIPQILSSLEIDPEARFNSPKLALETA